MTDPAALVRAARTEAGLTQAGLARLLGVDQSVVARLEHPGTNPTVATLERALAATGRALVLDTALADANVDEGLIRRHLALTPAQRLRSIEHLYEDARVLAQADALRRDESS